MSSSGIGIHTRSARSFVTPIKNDERTRQTQRRIALELNEKSMTLFEFLKSSWSGPSSWTKFTSEECVQFSKVVQKSSGIFEIAISVVVKSGGTWSVLVNGKQVPFSSKCLQSFPRTITDPEASSRLLDQIDQANMCPGNPEEKFVDMCLKKGGSIKGERGNGEVVGFIDNSSVINVCGSSYPCTVRRVDCDVLCEANGKFPIRCDSCRSIRSTLRSCYTRHVPAIIKEHSATSTSSHAKYCSLTPVQKSLRLGHLHQSLRSTKQQMKRMEAKAEKLIHDEGMELNPGDSSNISAMFDTFDEKVQDDFAEDSPQRVFWNQQKQYRNLKDKRQIRWHPLMIRFALNLKYLSTSAYKAVRQSGLISLPSDRTLSDYTHWTKAYSGLQLDFVEQFKVMVENEVPTNNYQCVVSMDEMKIKSGLVFDKHSGSLAGFVDLGSVNRDLDNLISKNKTESKKLADQVLARAVFKPTLAVPIAHYFSLNLRAENIFPLAWEVVEALEMYHLPVVAITSDGAKPNRRFYRLCQHLKLEVPYKTSNPFQDSAEIYFFCDPPHLLKTARNCFSNSFAHSKSRKMQKEGEQISWKWIESLYLTETATPNPGVRLCFKLTRDHIWLNSFTRMRVYLAAQVMSESVATALEFLNNDKTKQTRIFIRMIDRFFDYMNVKSFKLAGFKRKESIAPYTSSKDERFKWLQDVFLGYLNEWAKEAKSQKKMPSKDKQKLCLSKETMDGLKITVKSFTELGPQLLKLPGVKYLLSEVFSQDPLERYFSRQRHRGGSNDNPTAYQVPYTAATLLQQQSVYKDLKTMNVERSTDKQYELSVVSQPLKKRQRTH